MPFTVQVTDGLGATATISPTFWMYQHIALAGDSTICFLTFMDCALQLPITGGVPNGKPSVALVAEAPQPGDPKRGGCWNQQSATPLAAATYCTSPPAVVHIGIECT